MRLYPDSDLGVVIMANTTRRYDHDAIARSLVGVGYGERAWLKT